MLLLLNVDGIGEQVVAHGKIFVVGSTAAIPTSAGRGRYRHYRRRIGFDAADPSLE